MAKPIKALSASRIKTLESCSWIYWANYHLKLPDQSNSGSIMGSGLHNVYECLGNPRHKKLYEQLLKGQCMEACPVVHRYLSSFITNRGLTMEEFGPILDKMLIEGINYDFFGEQFGTPDQSFSEIDFDIEKVEGDISYRIRGFIDKLFLFKKSKEAVIRDFKSSKRKFVGKEFIDNIQDLMYRLAQWHLYPEYMKQRMEFVFMQFDCSEQEFGRTEEEEKERMKTYNPIKINYDEAGVIVTPQSSIAELKGFEYYLTDIQKVVDNFNESLAKDNFAKDKGYPEKYNGFSGQLICGRADSPTHKKKDGSIMWGCSFKFAKFYWVLLDENGGIVRTADIKRELPKAKKGQKVERRFYSGCPKYSFLDYNKDMATKAREKGLEVEEEKQVDMDADLW